MSPPESPISDSSHGRGPIGGAPPTIPTEPSAADKRAKHPLFQLTWSLEALLATLPLVLPLLPVEKNLPSSPKARYRSM